MCGSWFIILLYNTLYDTDMEDVNFSNQKICKFHVHEGVLNVYIYIYIYIYINILLQSYTYIYFYMWRVVVLSLRHYATHRQVAGSIPDGVIGIFQ
jgi:hypothetical protein